ncbi:hypothetical protein HOB76_06165 [Candidatus Woesearchaeota archaeon]|nr:hypothetical protein [Candidatus Woesearchaeota archaeon]MBT4697844.1 hypothetical protein [Candidatus Woesearchaeota archaeon]
MTSYLIEFRFQSVRTKQYLKRMVYEVNKRFNVGKGKHVPHISLAGPLTTNNERKLISDFAKVCSKTKVMKFKMQGFGTFSNSDGKNVVHVKIGANERLNDFRVNIRDAIKTYCTLKSHDEKDHKDHFGYHSTIAMKLSDHKFQQIKRYINSKPRPDYSQIVMRMTLIKGGKILREYDFMQRRLLTRGQALHRNELRKSKELLRRFMEGTYNPNKGLSGESKTKVEPAKVTDWVECPTTSDNLTQCDSVPKTGLIKRFTNLFSGPKTYLTSDLHLDHANIIRYCNRPFKDKREMNKVLVKNWNNTIRPKDKVYFLGDLAYGRGSHKTDWWLKKLNGDITFIDGNHDNLKRTRVHKKLIIQYKSKQFMLVHNPRDIPSDWKGWVICGHHHNNHPNTFPLVNMKDKIINVSTELTDYKPILFDEILEMME